MDLSLPLSTRLSCIRRHEGLRENGEALLNLKSFFSATVHTYRAYGLLFSSEVPIAHFPEALSAGDPDVRIRRGEIFGPGYTPPASIRIEASPGRILLRGARSATILVTGGNSITIEPLPNGNPATIMQILLGWALGGLFHQRAMLPLHGSALCRNDDCFVFCARSGAGKSTLAAAFLNRGFSFLDDNIALADFHDGISFIASGSPEIRLWESSMPVMEFDHKVVGRIRPDMDKVSIIAERKFRSEKARLRKIFILRRSDEPTVSFVNVTGAAKFQALLENVFFIQLMKYYGNSAGIFHLVHKLAERVPVMEIRLPGRLPPPDALCDIILGARVMQ
jgi:hypothetical protein